MKVILTKEAKWKDEAEWRMLYPLANADRKPPETPDGIYLFKFPKEAIKSITLGCHMNEENQEKIKKIIKEEKKYSDVKIFQTKLAETQY